MNPELKKILPDLAWGVGILLLALVASFAFRQGYITHDTMLRVVIGTNGLMIVYFGNRAPKVVAPSACARRLTRFSGWAMVLSGLVYAGLWAFAPIKHAITFGTAAVALGMILTFAYCFRLRAQARAGSAAPGPAGSTR
jgi:hypothetical protein